MMNCRCKRLTEIPASRRIMDCRASHRDEIERERPRAQSVALTAPKEAAMKTALTLATAILFLTGTAALANDNEATTTQQMKTSATVHKHHVRHHSYTTGIGPENNAAAEGSLLPGKDRQSSRAWIKNK
jgi:hypothetical protein